MLGVMQLTLLAWLVAFACGSETCTRLSEHQPAGVGLLQRFQQRHTAASPAGGPSISYTFPAAPHEQQAHVDIIPSPEPLRGAPASGPQSSQSPQSAITQLLISAVDMTSVAARSSDAATQGPVVGVSQVIQQGARPGVKTLVDTNSPEVDLNQQVALEKSNTSVKMDQQVSMNANQANSTAHNFSNASVNMDQQVALSANQATLMKPRAVLNTTDSITTNSLAEVPRSPMQIQWGRKTILDGLCVIGALIIMFLFLVLADVI